MAAFFLIAIILAAPFFYLALCLYVSARVRPIYLPVVLAAFVTLPVSDSLLGRYVVMPSRCKAGGLKIFAPVERKAGLVLHSNLIGRERALPVNQYDVGFTEELSSGDTKILRRRADGTQEVILRVPEQPMKNAPPRYFSPGKLVHESWPRKSPGQYGVAREADQPDYGDWGPTFATQLQAKYEIKIGSMGATSSYQTYRASIIERGSGAVVALVDGHAYLGGFLEGFFTDDGYKRSCYFGSEAADMLLRATFQDRIQSTVNAPVEPERR